MGRKAKPPVEKECPKCGTKHTRDRSRFCSTKCGNSRTHTEEDKRKRSLAQRAWKQTDAGEDNSYQIRKDRTVLPTVPHPERRLKSGQFVAGDELWNIVPGYEHPDDDWND